ncbi:MAG: hypothetical protein H7282_02515 [Cytophagaceae bacterium]|nr:hypothetical protein [Cytophagaceae bacterium]
MRKIYILAVTLLITFQSVAQKLDKEATIDISGKAKRGYLGNVIVDDSREQLDLVFVTKATNRKVKFEAYQFDYNLKLINKIEDEQEVDKAKSKYSWFNFKGDSYAVEGVTAEGNLLGKFVVKKRRITYSYSWLLGRYRKNVKTLDKVKFETPNGRKMFFLAGFDNDQTGEVLALAGHQPSKGENSYLYMQKMSIMRVNFNLALVSEKVIDLKYPQALLYSGPNSAVDAESDEQSNWFVVFAPSGFPGKKERDPAPDNYTLVEITPTGDVVRTVNFKSKCADWLVSGVYAKGDEIYIYGPGVSKKAGEDYVELVRPTEESKFTDIQIACIKGNAAKFVSATNVDEFKAKVQGVAGDKNPTYYNGKKVDIRSLYVAKNGDLLITAQDFRVDKQGDAQGILYKDLMLFHFDAQGKLITQYGIENEVKKGGLVGGGLADPRFHAARGTILESADGKSLCWMLYIPYLTQSETEDYGTYKVTTFYPRRYPKVVKIDLEGKKIAGVADYGDKEYFLLEEHPFVEINDGKQGIYIGESKNGKSIWLGKFDPAKL